MTKITQKFWKGLLVGVDKTDLIEGKCQSCSNIDISVSGRLQNVKGFTKIVTTNLGDQIDGIHQLKDDIFVVTGGNIKLL